MPERTRWWRVAGIGAATVLLLFAAIGVGYLALTGSDRGRASIVRFMETQANRAFEGRGRLVIGALETVAPGRLVARDVALVDSAGTPVLSVREVRGAIAMRALLRRVVHLTALDLRGLTLDLRQGFSGPWNLVYLVSGVDTAVVARDTMPRFGDDVRVDAIRLSDGVILTEAPWAPADVFTGRARDSVIAVRDSLHDLVRTPAGFLERRRIDLARVVARDLRVVRPDHGPSTLALDSVVGVISDPPVRIVQAAGTVAWTPDSLRVALPVVQLPHSTGSARGTLTWAEPGAVRYDFAVEAAVGLADLGWIWPVLPDSGGGRASVRLRTLEDPLDLEVAITGLDVEAMASRVRGDVTVVARVADLLLRDVDLAFAPLGVELAQRLSEGALPPALRGHFTGRFVAKTGGPLTNLRIDRLDARFVDGAVPGATSALQLSGVIDVGVSPGARALRVIDADLDLRSLGPIAPSLPPIDGRLSVQGTVVSAGLEQADVRGLAMRWVDAEGNASVVQGDVQAAFGGRSRSAELSLRFEPVSMRALARIDTTVPLRSALTGRFAARGPLSALQWQLEAAADSVGRIAVGGTAGLVDSAWQASVRGVVDHFDVRSWLGRTDVPVTDIGGALDVAATGTRGTAGAVTFGEATGELALRQREAADRPGAELLFNGALDARRLRIDSATVLFGGALFDARGALARDSLAVDTIAVALRVDSLGAMRPTLDQLGRTLAPMDSALSATLRDVAADSLDGDLSISGTLIGWLASFQSTLAIGARNLRVAAIRVGRVFGSARGDDLPRRPTFDGAVMLDSIEGIGAIRVATANLLLSGASADSGRVQLSWLARDTSRLSVRTSYTNHQDTLQVALDSLRFTYDAVQWTNPARARVTSTPGGIRLDSLLLRSNVGGAFGLSFDVPERGPITGAVGLDRFPAPEVASLALGSARVSGLLSGEATLAGLREAPLLAWRVRLDSLGTAGAVLPRVSSDGEYADRRLVARATVQDSAGGMLRAEARVPIDLTIGAVERRLLDESLDADVRADRLELAAAGVRLDGVSRLRGELNGRVAIAGTPDAPRATGRLVLDRFGAHLDELGIDAGEGRAVVRAVPDTLFLDGLRVRSGGTRDTIGARGHLVYAAGAPRTVRLELGANNAAVARRGDGTDVDLSGAVRVDGALDRPVISGRLFIPRANLVADPLGASAALDLGSQAARDLLGALEVPVAATAAQTLAQLGEYVTVQNARVDFGNDVWVTTPEAKVRVTGGLAVTAEGDLLGLEGEILANRGVYRLDLGVVRRAFTIDSGRVRFFGSGAIAPTLDITATHVVRLATGEQIPVRVHIGGTIDDPVLTLRSTDPLYAAAPESEIISLLIFGAPTFALDGQSQSTVRAVTGVLLPSVGGAVEGTLQRLLPVFNTVQVTTAGGQTQEELSALSLLDNLSITAGKQIGERTYLRLNTGACRAVGAAASRGVSLWYGLAAEYRLAPALFAQVGVDPGAAPCTRLGGDVLPRMQFGFDLFREWVF
jgi:translocation and assembly module TamB